MGNMMDDMMGGSSNTPEQVVNEPKNDESNITEEPLKSNMVETPTKIIKDVEMPKNIVETPTKIIKDVDNTSISDVISQPITFDFEDRENISTFHQETTYQDSKIVSVVLTGL